MHNTEVVGSQPDCSMRATDKQWNINAKGNKIVKGSSSVPIRSRGQNYYVFDTKFFEVNWKKEIQVIKGSVQTYKCRECPMIARCSSMLKDHIWCNHYHERFECIYCPEPKDYKRRVNLVQHIKLKHPSKYLPTKSK